MGKLLDYWGEFQRRAITCRYCGWSGKGADMGFGDASGHGIDRHCPECGERHGLAQYSIVVADDAPDDWPAKVGPAPD